LRFLSKEVNKMGDYDIDFEKMGLKAARAEERREAKRERAEERREAKRERTYVRGHFRG
jgi:hypothetical protein